MSRSENVLLYVELNVADLVTLSLPDSGQSCNSCDDGQLDAGSSFLVGKGIL